MSEEVKDDGGDPKVDSSNNEIFYLETNDDQPQQQQPTSTSATNSSPTSSSSKRENGFLSDSEQKFISKSGNDGRSGGSGGGGGGENKRQRSQQSTSTNTLPTFGITPPNFVAFEEIMKTANEISNLALVNEIVLNKDFELKKKEDSSDLESAVRQNMKKAFWDILEEQLAEQPPNYKQAISLLEEIKESLLLFLTPKHVQLKNEIDEILDLELIKQQVENGIFDFQRYAQYILSVCSRLCCPVRDEMIKKLTEVKEMIPLFKGIFELLELMRLDFANFYIKQFRPHIQLAAVEYEREKFKNLIEQHQRYHIDVLEYTTKWLKRNYDSLDLSQETNMKNLFCKVLNASYIDLLKCLNPSFNCYRMHLQANDGKEPIEDDYPETLLLIRNKIDAVREKIYKVTFISSIFVVTFAAIGEPLQSIKDFRLKLKNQLEVIISTGEDKPLKLLYLKPEELKSILTSASLQVISAIEHALEDYDVKLLNQEKLDSLKFQIEELATTGNRIRCVMERRILEFIERVLGSPSSQQAAPIQVPSGLSTFANELIKMASKYTGLVSYNRAVYSPYYTKIIAEIAGPTHFIPPSELKAIEKSFYD